MGVAVPVHHFIRFHGKDYIMSDRITHLPKILVDNNIPYISGRLEPVAEVTYLDQFGFTPGIVKDADAMIIRTRTKCNSDLLQGSSVKKIATATIGTDQIDIPWCQEAGISVSNSPGCNAPAVAQYVWAALLRLGFDPYTQTLGIVGCGNVGSIVAQWGRMMGARILISDPPREEKGIPDDYVPLHKLMEESDAVTLHTPLIRDGKHPTFHLIGEKELSLMKPNAILVNAARGPVLDSEALLPYLRSKALRGVIDTWEGEPELSVPLLNEVEIGTFHIAGYSRQGKERATRMVLEAMERFFDFEVDKSGLSGPYIPPVKVTPEDITASYDPYKDSALLKESPHLFDILRRDYDYREEVRFNHGANN